MKPLLRNIRFYILIISLVISIVFSILILNTVHSSLQIVRLTQIYALTAIVFLYFALLAGPFCYIFKRLPFRSQYLKARRAIGVSAFYFGLLHAMFAFFGQLGGFGGLGFLSNKYLLAISLSFIALIILFLMAATSFDFMVAKMTFLKWKLLHRFVYLAGVLILIHALMLGTHFSDLLALIPQLFFAAFVFLIVLESLRLDTFLKKRFLSLSRFNITTSIAIGFIVLFYLYSFFLH